MQITIPRILETDIMNFVRLNEIEDINGFLSNCLRDGFNIAKYGYSPKDNFEKENKPFKIENYGREEESNTEGLVQNEVKKKGRPKKKPSAEEESVISEEKREEIIKPKKRKITIINK
jgi:hypothetical protein